MGLFTPKLLICTIFLLMGTGQVLGWDSVEMEVFDVVEEVNQNFYELMGIAQDAGTSDIKKAYRTLSKQLHPDKNDAPDAEIKFRQLVAVYETLKDAERRKHYDRVLVDGLPDWRSAVYYYRRARKMSMLEIALILTIVISISQYLMAWGSYWDKYRTLEYHTSRKPSKKKKKMNDGTEMPTMEELEKLLVKPSMLNILPIQLSVGTYRLIRYGPGMYKKYREETKLREKKLQEEKEREEEEERQRLKKEEELKARRAANPRKRTKLEIPDLKGTYKEPDASTRGGCILHAPDDGLDDAAKGLNTGLWSDEEFSELAKLMNKYPGGTVDRWEVIAEHLNRSAYEVTKMAQRVKQKIAAGAWLQDQQQNVEAKIKVKTKGTVETSETSSDEHWSAIQQKSLEKAITVYPKGTDQRWEKIAKNVPDKNADDCINRFKFLAERIRKRKEEQQREKEEKEKKEKEQEGDDNESEENGESEGEQ